MRCDGTRPTCTQCIKADTVVDCEYSDGGPTPSQILERNIVELEARINEILKGPPTDSVSLQKPYGDSEAPKTPKTPKSQIPAFMPSPPPSSPGSLVAISPKATPKGRLHIPFPDSPDLLQTFIAFAPHLGFFFHIPRFLDKIKLSMPPTESSPIPPALVFSVLLLDCVFSNGPDRQFLEPQLFSLVLQSLSSHLDPSKIVYTLQAEVLTALYLLHNNRRLAASYHVSAAVSIAVACNLHKIRSASIYGAMQSAITLPPPVDDIEEGERIRAFWTVYILDRGWTLWTHASSALLHESSVSTQIDTPWPMEMHEYEQLPMLAAPSGVQTVQLFLKYPGTATEIGQSILSLRAKASIFLDKTARLCAANNFDALHELHGRMQAWVLMLPPLAHVPADRTDLVRGLLTVRTMCCCARILVHSALPNETGDVLGPLNDRVAGAALEAASMLGEVDLHSLVFVDTVCGILWGIVGKTLAACLTGVGKGWTTSHNPMLFVASLDRVMSALQLFGQNCPLIQWELSRLQSRLPAQ